MKISILVLLLLAVLYVFSLQGRRNHPGLKQLRAHSYAHRGLHDEDRPENSMAAFKAAVERGYGIELDIHLLADGDLAVIHDSLLMRTTGAEGRVEDLTRQQLADYRLEGTDQTIPAFTDVLQMVGGKTPLIVELKSAGDNYAALTEKACAVLENYPGTYCIESFDPRCIRWLKKNRPGVVRGQLAGNFMSSGGSEPWLLKFAMTYMLCNFLLTPDFVAYKFNDRKNLSVYLVRKLWGVQGVTWTLKTPEEYTQAVKEGWLPIFENFIP